MAPVLIVLSVWGYRNAEQSLQELSDTQLTDRTTLIAYDTGFVHHRLDISGFLHDTRLLKSNFRIYIVNSRGQVVYGPKTRGVPWIPPVPRELAYALRVGDTTRPASIDIQGSTYHFVTVPLYDGDHVAGAVQAGVPTHILNDNITRLLWVQIFGTLLALFVTAGGGVFLAYRASKPVELAAEQQRQFTNDAAHDLRTPIAIIRGQADVALMDQGGSMESQREALGRIRYESERLTSLVDDLLTLARTEAQGLEPTQDDFPLDELALAVSKRAAPVAEARGIRLTTDGTTLVEVRGDFDRLERALLNCVENAVQHTDAGGTITVRVGQEEGFGWIEIADTGAGIAADRLPLVGQRFYRADDEANSSERRRGSGLGLAITQRTVELHGGRLSVSSVVGQGTQVRLYLPHGQHTFQTSTASV